MKICRFNDRRIGEVMDGRVYDITELAKPYTGKRLAPGDPLILALEDLKSIDPAERASSPSQPCSEVAFLSPVERPGKIIAAPVNYMKHVTEASADPAVVYGHTITNIEDAGLFLKANSSLVGPSEGVAVRFPQRRTDYEVEIVVVIGRTGTEISRAHAFKYIAGYALGLDITLRGPEDRSFRKSIDTYSVVGPWLTTMDEVGAPNSLSFSLHLNNEIRQTANMCDMVYGVERLVEFASAFYTLYPGDILFTGTPEGVGPIHAGDVIEAAADDLGSMRVLVRAAAT